MKAGEALIGIVLLAALFLGLAWKTAFHRGLDRFVLLIVGAPWQRMNNRRVNQLCNVAPAASA